MPFTLRQQQFGSNISNSLADSYSNFRFLIRLPTPESAAAFLECCLDAPRDEVVTDALQKLCQSAPQSAPALPALPLLASSS